MNNEEITRAEALKKMGKYAAFTALGTMIMLTPKQAQAHSPNGHGHGHGGGHGGHGGNGNGNGGGNGNGNGNGHGGNFWGGRRKRRGIFK